MRLADSNQAAVNTVLQKMLRARKRPDSPGGAPTAVGAAPAHFDDKLGFAASPDAVLPNPKPGPTQM